MANNLFKVLTGIEVYQIPELVGHEIIVVYLEDIESILSDDVPGPIERGNEQHFNALNFADALSEGYIPCVSSLFVDDLFVMNESLEIAVIKKNRHMFVTKQFINRLVKLIEDILDAESKVVLEKKDIEEEVAMKWKKKAKMKITAMCLLDTCWKIMKNETIPGPPFAVEVLADFQFIDNEIEVYRKAIEADIKNFPEAIDRKYIIRSLRSEYFKNIGNYE